MAKENGSLSLSDVYTKEHRRRRRIILGIVLLIGYGIFLGGTWLVIRSPLFQIQTIEVSGNQRVSSDDIRMLAMSRAFGDSFWKRTLGFQNILVWPKTLSPDDLKFIPELKSLSIKKNYEKRSIAIAIEERQPFGVWCFMKPETNSEEILNSTIGSEQKIRENEFLASEPIGKAKPHQSETPNKSQIPNSQSLEMRNSNLEIGGEASCWWFDDKGVLFTRALRAEGNLIIVVDDYSQKNLGLNSSILPNEFIKNIFSVFKAVSDSGLSVQEIRLNDLNLQEIEIDTYLAPKLYFSLRFPADNTLAVIQSLEKQPGFEKFQYLDFRVENRAYYK